MGGGEMSVKTPSDALMTVAEVAQFLRVSKEWVHQHSNGRRQPTIPSVRLGTAVRFLRTDVLEFVQMVRRAA